MENMDITEAKCRIDETLCDYIPENLSIFQVAMLFGHVRSHNKSRLYKETIEACDKEFNKYKFNVIRLTHSNNWLKRHGYPMKRQY